MSTIYLIGISYLLGVNFLGKFLVSQEIYIVSVFLRYGFDFRVGAAKNMSSPLVVVKSNEFNPSIEILILTFYDALLPLLVVSDIII